MKQLGAAKADAGRRYRAYPTAEQAGQLTERQAVNRAAHKLRAYPTRPQEGRGPPAGRPLRRPPGAAGRVAHA